MRTLIIVVSLFALFFSAAGYLRVKNPVLFDSIQKAIVSPAHEPEPQSNTEAVAPSTGTVNITPVDKEGNSMVSPATYELYSPDKLARADTAPVVLFFNATWCPSCISTDRIFKKKITSLPSGVSILSVDYDTATELKERYNITYQHTFIQVDSTGKELARWSGGAIDGVIANLVQ